VGRLAFAFFNIETALPPVRLHE